MKRACSARTLVVCPQKGQIGEKYEKREEKEINEKSNREKLRLKKPEIRKFKRDRGGKKRADAGKSREGGGICRGAGWPVAVLFPGGIGGTAGQQYQRADFQFLRSDGRGRACFGSVASADTTDWTKKWSFTPNMKSWAKRQYRRKATFWNRIPGGNESFTVKENGICYPSVELR